VITATIEGVDIAISGLEQVGVDAREAAYYAVIEALKVAFDASKTMLSADDHTLRALAELGHPYGFKHPAQIHDPDEIIHAQTGEYLRALRIIPPVGTSDAIIEGSIVNDSPLDRWLQEGTSKMRARPWMAKVVELFGDDIAELIEQRITAKIAAYAA
jgi:hypothetical protein